MNRLLLCLLISFAGNVYAATNSAESTVKQITIGDTFARIKLASMTSMEGCTDQGYYYLDLSNGKNTGVLSVVLAAKAIQSPIIIQANGCTANYPSISHVYSRNK